MLIVSWSDDPFPVSSEVKKATDMFVFELVCMVVRVSVMQNAPVL